MAFDDIPDDIKKNYDQLMADRGWSPETAAKNYERSSPRLAAYLRSLATDDPKSEPKARRGSARSKVDAAAAEPTGEQKSEPTGEQKSEPTGQQTADAGQA